MCYEPLPMRNAVAIFILLFSTGLRANVPRNASCEQLLRDAWLRNVVIQNMNELVHFPGNWAMASQQILLNLMGHFQNPNLDFAFFERFFRQTDVPLFLVANSQTLGAGLCIGYPPVLAKLKGAVSRSTTCGWG